MPQKSRSKRAEPKLLSKLKILREYGISSVTWDWLEATKVLQLPRSPRPGSVQYEVSPESDKILRMARNHYASFPGYRPPCLRYLMWAFLVMPLDDIVDDLAHRKIINRSLNHTQLNRLLLKFMEVLPPSIQKLVREQKAPETKIQQEDFDNLLKITGLYGVFYNKAAFVDRLYFETPEAVHLINQVVLTSDGSVGVKCEIIDFEFGRKVMNADGLSTYKSLFMDFTVCDKKSWSHYTLGYAPQVRQAYRKAVDLTTQEFAVMTQIERDEKKIIGFVRSKVHAEVLAFADAGIRHQMGDFSKMVGTMLKLDEHEAKIMPGATGPGSDKAFRAPNFWKNVDKLGEFSFNDRFGADPLQAEEGDTADAEESVAGRERYTT